MGVDFRTGGNEGLPVFAVDDGYISRMVTNYAGYGKALYLTTNDKQVAVYAHLSDFTPSLEKILKIHQAKNESYFVNQYFTQEMIPVKKGELIGYSGNTGSSFGPHLHFEFRNENEQPLNPLVYGFAMSDRVSPHLNELALIPLESGARVQSSPLSQTFPLFRDRAGYFHFPDTLHCSGKIGFAVQTEDKIQNSSRSYQIRKLTLIIDDKTAFSTEYDLLDFSESRSALTALDYRLNRLNLGDFHRLFRMDHHPITTIYPTDEPGLVSFSPGYHKIEIQAEDAAGNVSKAGGTIFSYPPLTIQTELVEENKETKTFLITPVRSSIPIQSIVCYSFTAFGYADKQLKPLQMDKQGKGIKAAFKKIDIDRKNLQFIGTNKMGAISKPIHWFSPETAGGILDVKTDLDISHTDAGVFLQVELEKPLSVSMEIRLQKGDSFTTIRMERVHPAAYLSGLLPPAVFKDVTQIQTILRNGIERTIAHHTTPKLCTPQKTVSVLSVDKNCSIRAPKETLYDPTLVWIDHIKNGSNIKQGTQCSEVYQLQPFEIPLKTPMKVGIRYEDEFALEKGLAIYMYNAKKEKWKYLPSKNSPSKRIITAEIKELNAVTILQDKAPPVVEKTFPTQNIHYDYQDVEIIRVYVDDDLSGIAPNEESIALMIDGHKVYPAYQPIKKEISYRLTEPFKAGKHTLNIFVQDKAGNSTKKTIQFSIK